MTTLVIGDNQISKDIVDILINKGHDVICPTKQDIDITKIFQIEDFIRANHPFDNIIYAAEVNHPDSDSLFNIEETFNINVIGFIRVLKAITNRQVKGTICAVVSVKGSTNNSIFYRASKAALEEAIKYAGIIFAPEWKIFGTTFTTADMICELLESDEYLNGIIVNGTFYSSPKIK